MLNWFYLCSIREHRTVLTWSPSLHLCRLLSSAGCCCCFLHHSQVSQLWGRCHPTSGHSGGAQRQTCRRKPCIIYNLCIEHMVHLGFHCDKYDFCLNMLTHIIQKFLRLPDSNSRSGKDELTWLLCAVSECGPTFKSNVTKIPRKSVHTTNPHNY